MHSACKASTTCKSRTHAQTKHAIAAAMIALTLTTLASHPASTLHSKMQAARPTSASFGSSKILAETVRSSASVIIDALTAGVLPYTQLASKVMTTTANKRKNRQVHGVVAGVPFKSSSKLDRRSSSTAWVASCLNNTSFSSECDPVRTLRARQALFRTAASSSLPNRYESRSGFSHCGV